MFDFFEPQFQLKIESGVKQHARTWYAIPHAKAINAKAILLSEKKSKRREKIV